MVDLCSELNHLKIIKNCLRTAFTIQCPPLCCRIHADIGASLPHQSAATARSTLQDSSTRSVSSLSGGDPKWYRERAGQERLAAYT